MSYIKYLKDPPNNAKSREFQLKVCGLDPVEASAVDVLHSRNLNSHLLRLHIVKDEWWGFR